MKPIHKPGPVRATANLQVDPSESNLGWDTYRAWLDGLPNGGINLFDLVVALSQRLAIDIPDVDASHLVTLGGETEYLAHRLGL